MIKVTNLQYKYKHQREATLQDISFTIKPGEIIVVVGKNGAGKSTLGKLLSGIIKPRKGEVLIDNLDISVRKNRQKIFEKAGIVFQNPETQIIFGDIRDEISFTQSDAKEVEAALQLVGLGDQVQTSLWDLSLGQKQRVVLAEILARKPKYIILDEPTTMINSADKMKIHTIIRTLAAQGIGILLITNSAEELLLGQRILVLANGKVISEIKAQELLEKAEILEANGVALPQLLQLARELQKVDLTLNPKQWTPQAVVAEIQKVCL